jgi:hypothetical protein
LLLSSDALVVKATKTKAAAKARGRPRIEDLAGTLTPLSHHLLLHHHHRFIYHCFLSSSFLSHCFLSLFSFSLFSAAPHSLDDGRPRKSRRQIEVETLLPPTAEPRVRRAPKVPPFFVGLCLFAFIICFFLCLFV